MIDFSGGGWIVGALKLFEQSPVLRRMFYAVLAVLLLWVATKALPGIAELLIVMHG